MNIKTTRLKTKGTLFLCLLGLLFLSNCDTQDLEFVDPYEFVNDDFKNLPDLPPVEDEDPEIVEPETGSVSNSEETQSIITDVLNAGSTGQVSEETRTKLAKVGEFSTQQSQPVRERAQNLTPAEVRNLLDPSQELPADLSELRESLKDVPAEVKALLPKINFTADLEGLRSQTTKKEQAVESNKDRQKQSVTGPCEEAAYDAYDDRMLELTTQRDNNLFVIESNYARRLDEADVRYEERLALQAEKYEANLADMTNLLDEILASADEAESIGETELAEQLRMLTLIYSVDARAALEDWNTLALELIEVRMLQEKAQALEIREAKTAQVQADFAAAQAQADALLQESLNDCHNQGSGN